MAQSRREEKHLQVQHSPLAKIRLPTARTGDPSAISNQMDATLWPGEEFPDIRPFVVGRLSALDDKDPALHTAGHCVHRLHWITGKRRALGGGGALFVGLGARLAALDDQGDPLAAADAHGRKAVAAGDALEFVKKFGEEDSARGTDRVAERHRSAIGVHLFGG